MQKLQPGLLAKLALGFINKSRATALLLLGTLILGFFSYSTLLSREGFPEINFPTVFITANYPVEDSQQVNEDITKPLESLLAELEEVIEVQTITLPNSATIIAQLPLDSKAQEGLSLIQQELNTFKAPQGAQIQAQTINAGTYDGEHELILSLIPLDNQSSQQLEQKAQEVADQITTNTYVAASNVIKNTETRTDPETGEPFNVQENFTRVGFRPSEDEDLTFYEGIFIGVKPRGSADTLELYDGVDQEIQDMIDNNKLEGYTYNMSLNTADEVRRNISALESNLSIGLVSIIVILFFFVNWKASLLSAIFIPTVMAATFVALYAIGYSLNVLTLFALILVLGLFVDDAIVIIEAIDYKRRQGLSSRQAIISAINDIGPADLTGTITTLLVFLPLTFITGVLGEFIKIIPLTVILSLSLSIFIALTIIPFLSNLILTEQEDENKEKNTLYYLTNGFTDLVNQLGQKLGEFVQRYLNNLPAAFTMFGLSLLLILAGSFVFNKLERSDFPPPKDSDQLAITTSFPFGTSISQADDLAQDIESIIQNNAKQYVEKAVWIKDENEPGTLRYNLLITLTKMSDRDLKAPEIAEKLNQELEDLKDVTAKAEQLSAGPPQADFPFQMQVYLDDPQEAQKLQTDIIDFLNDSQTVELPKKATVNKVESDNPDILQKIDGRRYVLIKARFNDPNEVGTTQLVAALTQEVKEAFPPERLTSDPTYQYFQKVKATLSLIYNQRTPDLSKLKRTYDLKEDSIQFGFGMAAEFSESFESATLGALFAILAMYGILVLLYNSFAQPFLILLAIPFTFVLLFPGLYLTNNPFGFFTVVGIIGLVGIAVNNSIILVDFANQARDEGQDVISAASQAVAIRFRPIITTTITTLVALLPLALSDPFWEPLALSIIFGLISSTLMLLVFFPLYYVGFEKIREIKYLFQATAASLNVAEEYIEEHLPKNKKKK